MSDAPTRPAVAWAGFAARLLWNLKPGVGGISTPTFVTQATVLQDKQDSGQKKVKQNKCSFAWKHFYVFGFTK